MAIHKDIDPRGFLLNDNDTGVDHLGGSTFADAIAESLHHVETPITIGLYAKWGSGKSFLLKHIENILRRFQKQQEINDEKKKGMPDPDFTCKQRCKTVSWGLVVIAIFLMLLVTFLLAVKPVLITRCLGLELSEPDDEHAAGNSTMTTASVDVDGEEDGGYHHHEPSTLHTLKLIGLVVLPIELMLIFVFGCFGNSWLSPGYYGSCKLLTYGVFTKLPMRSSFKNIVEDPGESPANVLEYVKTGNERLAIAAAEATIYPRKYIFVNFKAWEYAGSDTLWAAIVTKITDAIEEEFGMITARLFRMLNIVHVKGNICENGARTLSVKFAKSAERNCVMDMMQQYGVVKNCEMERNNTCCWRIEFCTEGECRNAKKCLEIEGVEFDVLNPTESSSKTQPSNFDRNHPYHESQKGLIEMSSPRKKRQNNCDAIDLSRWSPPPKEYCCNRFCRYFLKHPIKILCLPRLIWWILILLCAVVTPVVAYLIADYVGLDIYRTYRTIPVYGQVLLWLPATAAVSAFGAKFAWAMCHSQRKRINAALDGTKDKMADELGFMSKVKSEIEVVTKLINCARFTHQKDYKVVITIDDLDRIQLKKVQSVLEAVNILLSDVSSPFICIVAVDSRVAVKCIEESLGDVLKESRITGQEYLKKIINLPICLPEINDSNKKRFIAGLIDQADHSVTYRVKERQPFANQPEGNTEIDNRSEESDQSRLNITTNTERYGGVSHARTASSQSASSQSSREEQVDSRTFRIEAEVHIDGDTTLKDANDNIQTVMTDSMTSNSRKTANGKITAIPIDSKTGRTSRLKIKKCSSSNGYLPSALVDIAYPDVWIRRNSAKRKQAPVISHRHQHVGEVQLSHEKFLFACRRYIYETESLHKHIHGNPRNMKRLFNVVSLTASLINSFLKKRDRRDFILSHSHEEPLTSSERDNLYEINRTQDLAKDVVRWVILTDQWPYRTSYILQVIEDANQRLYAGLHREKIPEDWSIFEIYEKKVKEECLKGETWLLSLDGDPDLFFSYLQLLKDEGFTMQKILELQSYTFNLDYSIRHAIAFERDISVLTFDRKATPTVEEKAAAPIKDTTREVLEHALRGYQKQFPIDRPYSWHAFEDV